MKDGGFRQLPRVRDYLLDVTVYDQLEEVATKHELPQERLEELLDLTDAVISGQLKVEQVPEFIEKAFGVDEQRAKAIAADVVGYRLLPLTAFIEGVEDSIKAWGGDVASYPEFRIEKPGLDDELLEYARKIGLELPENLMKRFIYLSKGYIEKERDREATSTLLKRPMNIGGLDLKEEQIESLLTKLDESFGEKGEEKVTVANNSIPEAVIPSEVEGSQGVDEDVVVEVPVVKVEDKTPEEKPRLDSKPDKATRTREMLPMKAVPHALTTDVPVISGHLFAHEEAEVKGHAERLKKQGVEGGGEFTKNLGGIVEQTAQKVAPIFKEAKQSQKSATAIAEAFVRGRLGEQRADALLQDKYAMSAEQSHAAIKILKDGYAQAHKTPPVKPKKVKVSTAIKESTVLDERHAALTSSVPKESIKPVMPSSRISAARSKQEELEVQSKKIDQDKVKQAQVKARPEKAKIRLSKESVPPKRQVEATRKMADVKKVSKLIGPVEELGTMGIIEFRRLSSDPNEAIIKVLNTLDLLEETDYEDRIKGIVAWRKSPVNKLYVSLVQDALTNAMTVADAAAKKRNAGDESLSAAEIDAIVGLNRKLSF